MIDYIITGLVIFLVGFVLTFFPPEKKLNKYGYRTKAAMQSKDHWTLAQKLAGRYFLAIGAISVVLGVFLKNEIGTDVSRFMAILLSIAMLLLSIIMIEKQLRKLR